MPHNKNSKHEAKDAYAPRTDSKKDTKKIPIVEPKK